MPNAFLHEIHLHESLLRTFSSLVAMADEETLDTIQNELIHFIFQISKVIKTDVG
jgi:hypothetical protein